MLRSTVSIETKVLTEPWASGLSNFPEQSSVTKLQQHQVVFEESSMTEVVTLESRITAWLVACRKSEALSCHGFCVFCAREDTLSLADASVL